MTKDNNKNKQTMTEAELNKLAIKIVSRMMNIQTNNILKEIFLKIILRMLNIKKLEI